MSTHHHADILRSLHSRRGALRAATVAGVAAAGALLTLDRASAASPLEIQTGLWGLYYYHGARDGEIGEVTRTAVRAFQVDRGLTVDGDPGPLTQQEVTAVVRGVQGAADTVVDGDYGPRTVAAVQEVQRAHDGLKADGRSGAETMAAMGITRVTAEERGRDHGHVGLFERWADEARTRWVILEQAYSTGGTARRTIGYPYSPDPASAEDTPYRYLRITD